MAMEERVPDEAEAAEEALEARTGSGDAVVPEADALEQAADVRAPAEERPDTVGDKPEADALEQARGVGDEDEEEYR
jgi:hypothetical protein